MVATTSVSASHSIECIRIKIAAAVYSITDMVIFEVYKKISEDKYYLVAILQEDEINEKVSIFEWDNIPADIMSIYEYVSSTSILEEQDDICVLYGTHIGRRKNYKYVLTRYAIHPCQEDTMHLLQMHEQNTENTDKDLLESYTDILQTMKIVKNLA